MNKGLENFLYYHKVRILVLVGVAVLATILTVNAVAKPSCDLTVAVICTERHQLVTGDLCEVLSKYATDRDGDGKVTVLVKDVSLAQGGTIPATERVGAIQDRGIYLYLVDQATIAEFDYIFREAKLAGSEEEITDSFVDLEERYPGNQNTEGIQYHLMGTEFQKNLGVSDMDAVVTDFGNLSFIVRTQAHAEGREDWLSCYDEALQVLDKIAEEK